MSTDDEVYVGLRVPVNELYSRYHDLNWAIWNVADKHPGWTVCRNRVSNLSLLDENLVYVGYIDVLNGEVHLLDDDEIIPESKPG